MKRLVLALDEGYKNDQYGIFMSTFEAQVKRIRDKLVFARAKDSGFKVFGADSHKYRLAPPLQEKSIAALERSFKFAVPEPLRAFFALVGNGPEKARNIHRHGGAGPYYGIQSMQSLIKDSELARVNLPCTMHAHMTPEQWQERVNTELASDREALLNGLLCFGTQGCSYSMAVVVNGPHAGRIIYIDEDLSAPPVFCSDLNFLDWYERWLDELLADYNMGDFGHGRGGNESSLIAYLQATDDRSEALFALRGFHKFRKLDFHTIEFLRSLQSTTDEAICSAAFSLLAKYDFSNTVPKIIELLKGSPKQQLTAGENLLWYGKPISSEWYEPLCQILLQTEDLELFSLMARVLSAIGRDFTHLLDRFLIHPSAEFRKHALWLLGESTNKVQHRGKLIQALDDLDANVQHTALQALSDLGEPDLLPALERLMRAYPNNEHYILNNVLNRVQEIGEPARPLLLLGTTSAVEEIAEDSQRLLRRLDKRSTRGGHLGGRV